MKNKFRVKIMKLVSFCCFGFGIRPSLLPDEKCNKTREGPDELYSYCCKYGDK